MSGVATAIAGSAIVGGIVSSRAADKAANAQTQAAQAGMEEQRAQFDVVRELLAPFVQTGSNALTQQGNLIGLNGNGAQQTAIDAIRQSPAFTALQTQGREAILQNASATGGLRGGNVQAALGQFEPGLLASLIEQQFGNLGGLSSLGQNSAAMTGNAGMATGNNITNLLSNFGNASAAGAINQANVFGGAVNGVGRGLGMYLSNNPLGSGGGVLGAQATGPGTMDELISQGVFSKPKF